MFLYNPNGDKVSVTSSQRKSLLAQGWTAEPKQEKVTPIVEEIPVVEDKPKRGRKPAVQTSEE